ncbi:hypothetical protein GWI33_018543 [Rhynchophorus ferrugineus]|uniref:SHSP domain-containing protein n=1 Tax=Rhynchophorus ferrugineus TaxID=354439 RepID=A0A834M1B9_RHYFE|nr:hypothetical protein GWI33_018543 [Rhynchophorus ferrugineus]
MTERDKFEAKVDVKEFKPEELTVKLTEKNTVTVEGKHCEKKDDNSSEFRHFIRKYVVPKDCDIDQVTSKLSSNGILSITVPKKKEKPAESYKDIPIITDDAELCQSIATERT